ncbi:MAG: FkbM family methyltransferase [Parcubacteria group bacterium Greene0416_79]|nr:MAG: FkbM family methyltransferase [Parcubacteria group bacterium Greene0416_79]
MIPILRTLYRRYIHWPFLDRCIYRVLNLLTDMYARLRDFYFPKTFIRRSKLDMLFELYEKDAVSFFKSFIRPGMSVVDIGAHIGYYTRIASRLVGPRGRVFSFEADPENFSFLKRNTSDRLNVRIYNLAVTDRTGEIDFYHYDEKAGCHSILSNVPLDFKKRKISVTAVHLDALAKEQKLGRLDLIKMDIEGGESAALKGMEGLLRGPSRPGLLLEFAPAWIRAAGDEPLNFLRRLESYGYELFIIKRTLIPLDTKSAAGYAAHIPRTPTHYNEFIHLFCASRV